MNRLNFEVQATAPGSRARAACFRTPHNEVLTPTFMPVGTHGVVRTQRLEDLLDSDVRVLLANTYHLMLRPGVALFEKLGGIHRFMNWPRSVLTDSGGYQIFSLPGSRQLREEGAEFTSYVDKTRVLLSPETSIAAQRAIGSDIMMVLDHCVPSTVERAAAKQAMDLTHRWARRSLAARGESAQSLFGIVQGARFADLRIESARTLTALPFDGFAIGGLAVGENASERDDTTAAVTEHLPADRPRYLMGVGTTRDLLEAVHRGVDMFDCILPTALAKQGVAFTSSGRRDLRRAAYRGMEAPLDPECACHTCRTFSIAYLFHLNRVKETQGAQLIGLHNIFFYLRLMRTMREHILGGTWLGFYAAQRQVLDARDSYGPPVRHVTKAQRQRRKLKLGRYEALVREGVGHIRDTISGEVMHSAIDPGVEARSLYVEQSALIERVRASGATPLVVWDVGLGAAANAMAAIHAVEASALSGTARGLELVSFESDLDSLHLALRHPAWFGYLHHAGPHALLSDGRWRSATSPLTWQLCEGDFCACKFEAPPPDIIFYDPFSFKTDDKLWSLPAFVQLAQLCAGRAVELFTYTAATRVRAGLLAAGFFVARGRGTGPKGETTIALTALAAEEQRHELLGPEWLQKWARSDAQAPLGSDAAATPWRLAITQHPQFQALRQGRDAAG